MKHKIGMFSAGKNGRTYAQMLELAKEMGFASMELYTFDDLLTPDLDVAKALADRAAQLDMSFSCMSVGANLMAEDIEAQLQRVKDYILVAQAAGAPYIHFTTFPVLSYDRRGVSRNKMIRTIAPSVRQLCDYAAEHDVVCVLEGQGYYMNGVEPLAQLLEEVDHENLGIVADLGNTLCVDEAPEKFVGYFAPVIRHVHIKDMVRRDQSDGDPKVRWIQSRGGSWLHRTELGTGVVDLEMCLKILASVGYQGSYVIENSYMDRLDKAAQDLRYMEDLLNRVNSGK